MSQKQRNLKLGHEERKKEISKNLKVVKKNYTNNGKRKGKKNILLTF